jgi:hypothetical protein
MVGDLFPGYSNLNDPTRLWQNLSGSTANAATNVVPGMEGAYQSLLKNSGPAMGDAASGLSSAMPYVGTGLGLVKSLLSGQMQKHPIGTTGALVGGLGGTLGGAALGAELGSVVPGIGTVLGAVGGALGSKIGSMAGGK